MRKSILFALLFVISGCCGGTTVEPVEIPEVPTPEEPALEGEGTEAAPYKLECTTPAKEIPDTGMDVVFHVKCPAGCKTGFVWGSDIYTTDSKVCVASVHAGATKDAGGVAKVMFTAGEQSYSASERNGISTSSWGPYEKSFKFEVEAANDVPVGGSATKVKGRTPAKGGGGSGKMRKPKGKK